jgi:type IV secretion system protein VirB10
MSPAPSGDRQGGCANDGDRRHPRRSARRRPARSAGGRRGKRPAGRRLAALRAVRARLRRRRGGGRRPALFRARVAASFGRRAVGQGQGRGHGRASRAAPPLYIPPAPRRRRSPSSPSPARLPRRCRRLLRPRRRRRKSSTCPRPPQWSSRSSRVPLRRATPAGRPGHRQHHARNGAAAQNGNAPPGVADFGAVQAGGRVRAGVFANRATTVVQGTLIPAVLETAFDSTRPGLARAIVSRDVRGFDGTKHPDPARQPPDRRISLRRRQRPEARLRSTGPAGPAGRRHHRARLARRRHARPRRRQGRRQQPFLRALRRRPAPVGARPRREPRHPRGQQQRRRRASRTRPDEHLADLPAEPRDRADPAVPAGTSISVFVARDLDFTNIERGK